MLTLRRLRWEGDTAKPLQGLLAPWGLHQSGVLLTKTGGVSDAFAIHGPDAEGMDDRDRETFTGGIEAWLRATDPSTIVSQYFIKRQSGTGLATTRQVLVLTHAGMKLRAPAWRRGGLWPSVTYPEMAGRLMWAMESLGESSANLAHHLRARCGLVRLTPDEHFGFLRSLVNPIDVPRRLPSSVDLDYTIADSSLRVEETQLRLGSTPLSVWSMKTAPSHTHAGLLWDALVSLPGDVTVCLSWQRLSAETARRRVAARRWGLAPKGINDARRDKLEALLRQLEVDGRVLGDCVLTVVLSGDRREDAAGQLQREFAIRDGAIVEQGDNRLSAWLGMIPGNYACNLASRRLPLTNAIAADITLLYGIDAGKATDHAGRPPLCVLPTQQRTPYRLHLHTHDVGHSLVLGMTGSGKTHWVNRLIDGAMQYRPRVVIFDIGHGYRQLAEKHGGAYLTLGLSSGLALNPFAVPDTPDHRQWVSSFVRVLIEGRDRVTLEETEVQAIDQAVSNTFLLSRGRRLGAMAQWLPDALQARIAPWFDDGVYASMFDHERDDFVLNPFQVYEFSDVDRTPDIVDPLLFLVLRRVLDALTPDQLTLVLLEELWRMRELSSSRAVAHPEIRAFILRMLKTGRKHNAAMLLVTQSIEDLGDLTQSILETIANFFLLANPRRDPEVYARLFGLNQTELELLDRVRERAQVLLKRNNMTAKILDIPAE